MDFCSEWLTRRPSSGMMARCRGEYQPISPGCAGIGKAPHSYAARASSSLKTRETPIRSSCRHSSGDPNGESISAYSHLGKAHCLGCSRNRALRSAYFVVARRGKTPPLASPQHGGARFPDARSSLTKDLLGVLPGVTVTRLAE